LILGSSTNGG